MEEHNHIASVNVAEELARKDQQLEQLHQAYMNLQQQNDQLQEQPLNQSNLMRDNIFKMMEEIKINKLEVEDGWTLWKFQIKAMLRAGGLWELVSGAVTKPEADGEPRKQWIKDDANAQKILVVSMGEAPLMHIINCETAAAMFATLESVSEQKSDTSIHLLQQQFFQYVKSAEDSIAMHIAKLQKIARQLEDLGEKISENMLVTKILMTLPEQYNHFFAAWEATKKKDRTLKMLTARLCMEESRLGVQPNTQGAEVMFVQSNISRESSWYMDSGTSDHMPYRKEWFHDYVKFDTPKDVRIADGSIVQAYGRGDIHVEAYNGNVWNAKYLADVLYVPGIKMNLFSSNACLDKGYSLIAEGNDCYF
ncbi:uncharacterized protein LOC129236360 [Anastrepha obliqua]|uniref:uncharacterized protein LOC129236360 n=1 Tax=Anastrepha obliqua TaxID=95512 RepID=UPI0024093C0E|nr:uncharacterized protein LOC129236360 [Anastrepha obliqua]